MLTRGCSSLCSLGASWQDIRKPCVYVMAIVILTVYLAIAFCIIIPCLIVMQIS